MMNFWQFVYERMSIYNKRAAGEPRPWTTDKTLQTAFFTNVFRELDPGTRVAEFIMSRRAHKWIRAWNILLYRRLNRDETWTSLFPSGFCKTPSKAVVTLEKSLRRLAKEGAIFTGAHEVSMMQTHKKLGKDYIARQANMMKLIPTIKKWAGRIGDCDYAKTAFEKTVDACIPGVGKFLAWQLVLDLRYGSDPIGKYSDNEWAPLQMGAKNGLMIHFQGPMPDYEDDLLRQMVESQTREFAKNGLLFSQVSNMPLTYAAMEHSLCEYGKYVRIAGGGHAKGKFDGEALKASKKIHTGLDLDLRHI